MDIKGWCYDYDSLPYWSNREKFPYTYDLLCKNTKMDMAFLIYSIVEVSMCNYVGFLAILENKHQPKLVLNIEEGTFCNTQVVFSTDGKLAFAKSSIWDAGWPIFIFDLVNQTFSCFKTITNNMSFKVKEKKKNEFVIVADKWQMKYDIGGQLRKLNDTKIIIDELEWMSFKDIDTFCLQLRKNQQNKP